MKKIKAFIGGTHLIDNIYEETEINQVVETLKKEYSETILFTGHCTGDKAMQDLTTKSRQIHSFYSGATLNIE